MEIEVQTYLCTSRLSLWCPVCGAREGQGCTPVKGLRFESHNTHAISFVATGMYSKPVGMYGKPQNREPFRPKWTTQVGGRNV
jgi:hypothetical protein